ncbi:MAG: hypothetical protein ABII94_03950 [Patescibacteria group bacterium]
MKLYCEKCQSEEVEIINTTPQRPENRVSIADYNGEFNVKTLEYRPQSWLIRCKNCGNKKETTEGSITINNITELNLSSSGTLIPQ